MTTPFDALYQLLRRLFRSGDIDKIISGIDRQIARLHAAADHHADKADKADRHSDDAILAREYADESDARSLLAIDESEWAMRVANKLSGLIA